MIWKNPLDLQKLNDFSKGSLSDLLGIKYTDFGEDFLTVEMNVEEKHLQPMGIMHGGTSSVIAETVGSMGANLCVDQKLFSCVGLEININHLRPIKRGTLIATAKPQHLGKKTQVWEIKILNEQGKLVAISRHTIAILETK